MKKIITLIVKYLNFFRSRINNSLCCCSLFVVPNDLKSALVSTKPSLMRNERIHAFEQGHHPFLDPSEISNHLRQFLDVLGQIIKVSFNSLETRVFRHPITPYASFFRNDQTLSDIW